MKEKLKRQKGITLIALVITIIVLLILAGVSIAMLTGENGILNQAQEAKNQTEFKSAEEKVKLAIMGARADDGQMTIDELKTEVGYQGGSVTGDAFPVQVQMDGHNFIVEATGEVTNKEEGGDEPSKEITASDIANATDKSEFYGATVKGYELPSITVTDVGWKILYADKNNIYLIADNCVERENLPNSTIQSGELTENKPDAGSQKYPRSVYFSSVYRDYVGTTRITDSRLQALNSSYFNDNKFSSKKENMKTVAYLMDTVAWNSKFKDVNNKAIYAIGGPTIEMLITSYNQKYGVNYKAKATSEKGYRVSLDGGTIWNDNKEKMFRATDELYVLSSTLLSDGYWVSSPTDNYYGSQSSEVWAIKSDGRGLGRPPYSMSYQDEIVNAEGVRPVVCLDTDVQLQKNVDGTFTIL